jgi:hypothetical protein
VESGGRSVVVPRAQAGELPALVTRLLASPQEDPVAGPPASLRLELAQGEDEQGTLELVGERWRWTPAREPRQARMLGADPALAAALREEAERVLAR